MPANTSMNAQIAVVFLNQMKVIVVFSAHLERLNAPLFRPTKVAAKMNWN